MSIIGVVENNIIKLPNGVHLPDGTKVNISLEATRQPFRERIRKFVGCIKDGPPDLASQQDHYAHGTRKRTLN